MIRKLFLLIFILLFSSFFVQAITWTRPAVDLSDVLFNDTDASFVNISVSCINLSGDLQCSWPVSGTEQNVVQNISTLNQTFIANDSLLAQRIDSTVTAITNAIQNITTLNTTFIANDSTLALRIDGVLVSLNSEKTNSSTINTTYGTALTTLNTTLIANDSILAQRIDGLASGVGGSGGGWYNTSDTTRTSLFVNVSKNVTVAEAVAIREVVNGVSLSFVNGEVVIRG